MFAVGTIYVGIKSRFYSINLINAHITFLFLSHPHQCPSHHLGLTDWTLTCQVERLVRVSPLVAHLQFAAVLPSLPQSLPAPADLHVACVGGHQDSVVTQTTPESAAAAMQRLESRLD